MSTETYASTFHTFLARQLAHVNPLNLRLPLVFEGRVPDP